MAVGMTLHTEVSVHRGGSRAGEMVACSGSSAERTDSWWGGERRARLAVVG